MTVFIRRLLAGAVVALLVAAVVFGAVYYVPDPGAGAPRVLVAADRTLWNAVRLNRLTYVRKLRLAGLRPVLVTFDEQGQAPATLIDGSEGLVLTGGGDVAAERYGGDPSISLGVKLPRDAFELALLALAEQRGIPILGLCRGAQLINVYRGGTLGDFRAESERFAHHRNLFRGHPVELKEGSRLAAIYGTRRLDNVTTWHGQHVDVPGRGLVVTAYSPDGIPEGVESAEDGRFVVGVQWHPEMPPWDDTQAPLFDAFASAVVNKR